MKTKLSTIISSERLLLSRREALKVLGAGIIVCGFAPSVANADQLPNGWLQIGPDGLITLYTNKTELGQGITTALAQIAAEELDAPLTSMRVVTGDTDLCFWVTDPNETWGSLTISDFGPGLRTAATRARALLIKIAAEQLALPESRLFTRDGYVIDQQDENIRVSYATLAGSGTIDRPLPPIVPVQDPATFTICGRPAIRIDAVEKVTGAARYAGDISLPGMLYARILRPPAHGATLTGPPDTTQAELIPGVQVVRTPLVAVLHPYPEVAEQALALVTAQYNLPAPGPSDQTIHDYILAHPPGQSSMFPTWSGGNLTLGESQAVLRRDLTYYTPFVAHAPMEPHAAVASYENGSVTVWASTQAPFHTQSDVAGALGLSTANVHVVTPYVGGAFGGKAYNNQQAVEAAQLSRAVGRPVNVTWTRKEEFFYDRFQPPCLVTVRAGLNASQQICLWDSKAYFTSSYAMTRNGIYNIPNHRTRFYGSWSNVTNLPFVTGQKCPWRAPGNNAFTFARESHIDALAAAAGLDPVEFRLRHLQSDRARNVLTRAAEAFGWQPGRRPSGRGFGVACGQNGDSSHEVYAAVIVALSVDLATGAITVDRMLSAVDCGRVINPDGVRQQMEGSLMMGLGYSLSEELHFQVPTITDLNFDTYGIPRFSWMPQLETVIVANETLAPMGCGEPPIVAVGGAVANAFFDATGLRATRLPITPERVLALLGAAGPPDLNPPEYAANQVRLSWVHRPGTRLQKATSLTNRVWEDLPLAAGQCSVSLPATEPSAFFRLARP